MRLFDKCISEGLIDPSDAKLVTVLACDVIAKYAVDFSEKNNGIGLDDAPFAIPPWNDTFAEFNVPIGLSRNPDLRQYAVLCQVDRREGPICVIKTSASQLIGSKADDIELLVTLEFFAYANPGHCLCWDTIGIWAMDKYGSILSLHKHKPEKSRMPKRCRPTSDAAFESLCWLAKIPAMAFTFANCSNVKTVDVTADLQPSAKVMRRNKLPEVKRYTLEIAGHLAKPSRDTDVKDAAVMPFHLCRGHFATYTSARPMFGNPKLTGRYWHPPHTRGKKERGEIVKDYAIQAEPAQS